MNTENLLHSSAALRRLAEQSPDRPPGFWRLEIASLVDDAWASLAPEEVCLRSNLCVVRSLALLGRPFGALAAFDAALNSRSMSRWPSKPTTLIRYRDVDPGRPMDVIATIVSYQKNDDASSNEMHRFVFELRDTAHGPVMNTITLRTAVVLARELIPTTAFARMIDAIVQTEDGSYNRLVGRIFQHA